VTRDKRKGRIWGSWAAFVVHIITVAVNIIDIIIIVALVADAGFCHGHFTEFKVDFYMDDKGHHHMLAFDLGQRKHCHGVLGEGLTTDTWKPACVSLHHKSQEPRCKYQVTHIHKRVTRRIVYHC
jgi:hypothetical protein